MNGAAGEKNSQGKGADIAKEEAAAWARQMEFIILIAFMWKISGYL